MASYVITPNSDIILLKCPLEIDSLHQIDFANATDQYNYFYSLPKLIMEDATYQRKDSRLYFEGSFDVCLPYNYCMYRNTNYSNKWFYAFVTDMRYENNNVVSCNLVTDVFQTWQFDVTYHQSFVERFIPAKQYDTIGRYTYPEELQLGDYISNDAQEVSELKNQKLVVGSTADYMDLNVASNGCYQNIPTGCGYYFAPLTANGMSAMQVFLQNLTNATKESAITSLFLAPEFLCTTTDTSTNDIKKVNNSYNASQLQITLSTQVTTINGYTPHNNKLWTYPYYFIQVTNGAGGSAILKPELWLNHSVQKYRMYCALTPGCSIIGVPMDYKGYAIAWEEALPLAKYPQLNYSTDQFTNWQTQNGLNNTMQQISGAVSAVQGAHSLATTATAVGYAGDVTGSGAMFQAGGSQYIGGMMQTLNAMHEKYLASLVPPQFSGNANSGDVWASAKEITFRFNWMSIRYEFAREIDHYFDMYGYRVNKLMGVNLNTRSNWNYIKTIDVNITGDVPEQDMLKFKSLFNNGFTVWHTTTHFLDYTETNA